MEVRIPCQWNLDSGFQSFAGSLIIQAGWQIPKPSNWNSTSKNPRKNSQILDCTSKGFSDYGWESGVPDMEQYTDSHWIVGTQVSAADFAGRKTKQKTDILTRIWYSKVANLNWLIDGQGRGWRTDCYIARLSTGSISIDSDFFLQISFLAALLNSCILIA